MIFWKVIKTAFFCILVLSVHAQERVAWNVNANNGLNGNDVRTVLVDSRRTVWVGTNNGICAFRDGQWEQFSKEDGIAGGDTWSSFERANGELWFGHYNVGVTRFIGDSIIDHSQHVHNKTVRSFTEWKGRLIIGTDFGIEFFDDEESTFHNIPIRGDAGRRPRFISFFQYKSDLYAIAYMSRVLKFNEDQNLFEVVSKKAGQMFANCIDGDSIYLSRGSGHLFISIESLIAGDYLTPNNGSPVFWDLEKYDQKVFGAGWSVVFGKGGLYLLDAHSSTNYTDSLMIKSKEILGLEYDSLSGLLYLASIDQGLIVVNWNSSIRHFPVVNFDKKIISAVWLNDRLFVLKSDELLIFDKFMKLVSNWTFDEVRKWQTDYPERYKDFKNEPKLSEELFRYQSLKRVGNLMYVGTSEGLIEFQRDKPYRAFSFCPTTNFYKYGDTLLTISPYRLSSYITSNDKGYELTCFDPPSRSGAYVFSYRAHGADILIEKRKGALISINGVEKNAEIPDANADGARIIFGVSSPTKGQAYIVNSYGDLFKLNIDDKLNIKSKFVRNVSHEGIAPKAMTIKDTFMVFYYNFGVRFIFEGRDCFIPYREVVGYTHTNFLSADEEHFLVSTQNGIFEIPLDEMLAYTKIDPVFKTSIQAGADSYDPSKEELRLRFVKTNSRNLDFQVTTSSQGYIFSNRVDYTYCLEGNKDTLRFDESNINLKTLPNEAYRLSVEIINPVNGVTKKEYLAELDVIPPLTQRNWFILLVMVIITGILGFVLNRYYRLRLARQKRVQEMKGRLSEVKLEALQSQMSPHFIFNAMNSIQALILKSDIDGSLFYLKHFSNLTRHALETANKSEIPLTEEVGFLESYLKLENLRYDETISYNIDTSDLDNPTRFRIPPMLIQPIVENAYKHAFIGLKGDKFIEIKFTCEDEKLLIRVIDSGMGMPDGDIAKIEGKAISVIRERLKILYPVDGTHRIHWAQNHPKGTICTIQLEGRSRLN